MNAESWADNRLIGQALLPEIVCAPVLRYSHHLQWDRWKAVEQIKQTLTPACLRGCVLEKLVQQGQDDKDFFVRYRPWSVPPRIIGGVGNDGPDGQFAIPETRMVGADISDIVQSLKPRQHDWRGRVKLPGDALLCLGFTHVEQREHRAKRHHFTGGPYRQIRKTIVVVFKMLHEQLGALLGLLSKVNKKLCVFDRSIPHIWPSCRRTKILGLDVCVGSPSHRQVMNERRSNGYFDSFNRINNGKAQLAIEPIAFPNVGKASVRDKSAVSVLGVLEGVPVSAEPVVPNRAQSLDQDRVIVNDEAATFQELRLILVRQRRFIEGLAHGDMWAKKDPPHLCLSLGDRGRAGLLWRIMSGQAVGCQAEPQRSH